MKIGTAMLKSSRLPEKLCNLLIERSTIYTLTLYFSDTEEGRPGFWTPPWGNSSQAASPHVPVLAFLHFASPREAKGKVTVSGGAMSASLERRSISWSIMEHFTDAGCATDQTMA